MTCSGVPMIGFVPQPATTRSAILVDALVERLALDAQHLHEIIRGHPVALFDDAAIDLTRLGLGLAADDKSRGADTDIAPIFRARLLANPRPPRP